jgi:hypothetical protein
MKRIAAVILLMCLYPLAANAEISTTAQVEAFSIRDGIVFLETKNNVADLKQGVASEQENGNLESRGTFAGIDNSLLRYLFNSDDNLVCLLYEFGNTEKDKNTQIVGKEYLPIEEALTEKYGEPFLTECEIYGDLYGKEVIGFLKNENSGIIIPLHSERLLKVGSLGYVKIEHYVRVIEKESLSYETEHKLIYTWFSLDDITALTETPESIDIKGDI